jgi:hypothetical protein
LQPHPWQRHDESVAAALGEDAVNADGDMESGTTCLAQTPNASAATARGTKGFMKTR